jgi:hypothetical protein
VVLLLPGASPCYPTALKLAISGGFATPGEVALYTNPDKPKLLLTALAWCIPENQSQATLQVKLPGETLMHARYKTIIRIALSLFAISALAMCLVITKLAYPAVPGTSKSMNYEGFISLPKAL